MVKLITIACLIGIIVATPGCCGCWSCGKKDSCKQKETKTKVVKKAPAVKKEVL